MVGLGFSNLRKHVAEKPSQKLGISNLFCNWQYRRGGRGAAARVVVGGAAAGGRRRVERGLARGPVAPEEGALRDEDLP